MLAGGRRGRGLLHRVHRFCVRSLPDRGRRTGIEKLCGEFGDVGLGGSGRIGRRHLCGRVAGRHAIAALFGEQRREEGIHAAHGFGRGLALCGRLARGVNGNGLSSQC